MPTAQSRPETRASAANYTPSNEPASAYNALVGANLAFHRAPKPPRSPSAASTSSVVADNGALAAAYLSTLAAREGSTPTYPNGSFWAERGASVGSVRKEADSLAPVKMPHTFLPTSETQPSTSPSHQAAVLAAARATPSSAGDIRSSHGRDRSRPARAITSDSRPPLPPKPRRLSQNPIDYPATERPTDTTSIAPTTSLVNLFEQRSKEAESSGMKAEPIVVKPARDLPLNSPKPVRSGFTSVFHLELPENRGRLLTETNKDPSKDLNQYTERRSSEESFASASEDLNAVAKRYQESVVLPAPASQPLPPSLSVKPQQPDHWPQQHLAALYGGYRHMKEDSSTGSISQSGTVSPSVPRKSASQPIPIKPLHRGQDLVKNVPGGDGSNIEHESMSVSSSHSLRSIPAQFNQAYPRKMTPLTTGDDLANALVASSLASSRAATPTHLDVTYKRKPHHHSVFSFSRTPSPAKGGMLHTLRKVDSSSESEDSHHPYGKHKKKRLVRKHPNKHHEGDRKRWREAVTERERKRYEGVWAANKGLYSTFTSDEQEIFGRAPMHQRTLQAKATINDQVSNIVAREVWTRSRLPATVLEVVWDLVDNSNVGRLQKEEFVVGMWLIDQRLKGRKLPVKVSETVWASVRGIQGIKVKK